MSVSRTNQTCINVESFQLQPDVWRSTRQNGQQVVWHPVCRDQTLIPTGKTCFLFPAMMPKPLPEAISKKILLILKTIPSQLPNQAGISRELGDDLWCEIITHLCPEDCNALANVSKQLDFIFKKMIQEKLTPILLEYPVVDTGSGRLPLSCQLQMIELVAQRKKFLGANLIEPKVIKEEAKYTCMIMRKGLKFSDIVFATEQNGMRFAMPLIGTVDQFEDWEKNPVEKTNVVFVSNILPGEFEPMDEGETNEILNKHSLELTTIFELFAYYAFEKSNIVTGMPYVFSSTLFSINTLLYNLKYISRIGVEGNQIHVRPACIANDGRYQTRVALQGKWCLAPKK